MFIFFLSINCFPNSDVTFYYFVNTTEHANIGIDQASILYQQGKFKQEKNSANVGFEAKSMWVYMKFNREIKRKVLVINNAHLDSIIIYLYNNKTLKESILSGDHTDFSNRSFKDNFFNFEIPEDVTHAFIKIQTEGPLIFPVRILPLERYTSDNQSFSILMGMFFGFIILTLISNLLIFIWLKESIHLHFSGLMLSIGIVTGVDFGYLYEFIWPHHPELNNWFVPILYLFTFYGIFFSEKLLNLKVTSPILLKAFYLIYFVIFLIGASVPFMGYRFYIQEIYYVSYLLPFISLFAAVYIYYKYRNTYYRFFLVGWMSFIIAAFAYLYVYSQGASYTLITSSILQIGTAFQVLFFNLSMLSRIKLLQDEKKKILSEQNKLLELKVIERTKELIEKKNEITSKNEILNNQYDELEKKNKIIEEKNLELEDQHIHLENLVEKRTESLLLSNKELVESEERFRFLAESIPAMVWISDNEGNNEYVNQNWVTYTGLKLEQMKIFSWIPIVLHPEDQEKTLRLWEACLRDMKMYENLYRVKRASDGMYRWHIARAFPLKSKTGNTVKWFGIITDIHEQKLSQENLIVVNKELKNTNEDLDNFIYTASHELKVPAANIFGLAKSIMNEIDERFHSDSEILKMLNMIFESLKILDGTVLNLTEIGRVQKEIPIDVITNNFEDIINQVISEFKETIEATGAVIKLDIKVSTIKFSKSNLKTILYQLISNAILYRNPSRQLKIQIDVRQSDSWIEFSISDNGLGIKKDYRNRLFKMFHRLHTHVEGSGMGLYITKRLIENAGGKISFESDEGKGSTFNVFFSTNI